MQSVHKDPVLRKLADRVTEIAEGMGRRVPEIRWFVLDGMEFTSLLEKNVYPRSPLNLWEGKRMVHRRHRIEQGQESTLYYEVVQTGNPSYAYLNAGNAPVTQASVMAHVVGHCEFSERNVLHDSSEDRTELVLYLVRRVERAQHQMGHKDYLSFWNACESATNLISPNSQFNLANSVQTESAPTEELPPEVTKAGPAPVQIVSGTLDALFRPVDGERAFEHEIQLRRRQETLSRRGFLLEAPCQDVFGFLRAHAPASNAERAVLDYMYTVRAPQDFVMRTQIMNEGWAMYWEKKIMTELFKEKAVSGIIDYARVFSGVCAPRPFFQRNPYHLGYNLWRHVEQLYRDGKVSLAYHEETDREKKESWKVESDADPVAALEHLVETITDYEFLRRFLTPALVEEFHLNRVPKGMAEQMGWKDDVIVRADDRWVWLDPEGVRGEMLTFYTHFYRPRIYLVDVDFRDGGLLLYHRDDGRALRQEWVRPTLQNINRIWKGPVGLYTRGALHLLAGGEYKEEKAETVTFDQVRERMATDHRPLSGE